MPNFKQSTLYLFITLLFFSGCTQVVTAPVKVAGSVVGTTLDVASGTVGVITGTGSDDEDDEDDEKNEED